MKRIVEIKEGRLGNIVTMMFLLALAVLSVWLERRFHGEVSWIVWLFAGGFVLGCYFPLTNLRNPKSRLLFVEGEFLIWRIRDEGSGQLREERLPLRNILGLQFVIPKDAAAIGSRVVACAELYFVTRQGRQMLPLEFFPGIYRERIIATLREHIPNLEVQEIAGAE